MEPRALVELPGGRLYNDCYIGTFKLRDVKEVEIIANTNNQFQLYDLIDNLINLSVRDLTSQDLWFILYWQRINSYIKNPIVVPWRCPHCSTLNKSEFTADNMKISDISEEYNHDGDEFETSVGNITLRLPTIGDDYKVREYCRDMNITDANLKERVALAVRINHKKDQTIRERLDLVDKMDADDSVFIQDFDKFYDYGVSNKASFNCTECEKEANVKLNFSLVSFFPSLSDRDNIRDRVLSRKASKSGCSKSGRDGLLKSDVDERKTHGDYQSNSKQVESPPGTATAEEVIG